MLKRMLSLATTCFLISSTSAVPLAQATQARNEQELAQKIKIKVEKIGIGPKARIEVRLKDGYKIKGHVSDVGADHFSVTDKRTGAITRIAYGQAKQVKTHVDNPLLDPEALLGLALIPTIIGIAIWAKDKR